jgi:hypothetical protein
MLELKNVDSMKNTYKCPISSALFARSIRMTVLAVLGSACVLAADSTPTAAERAARLEAARAEIAVTRSNIVLTLEQLDQVRHVNNPQAQFQRFVEQLAAMKERAKLTQERAQAMKAKGDAYFADWEVKTGALTDASARQQAAKARTQRKATYDQIIQQMQTARSDFTPLLKELEQIKALLEGERSQERVAAAKDLFTKANWHCVNVQRALMTTEQKLDSLAADFSGKGAGTSAVTQ